MRCTDVLNQNTIGIISKIGPNNTATSFQDIVTNIKKAVEKVFSVTVTKVNTLVVPGKYRRFGKATGHTKSWKKAMLRLKEGDKIELFEGDGS